MNKNGQMKFSVIIEGQFDIDADDWDEAQEKADELINELEGEFAMTDWTIKDILRDNLVGV